MTRCLCVRVHIYVCVSVNIVHYEVLHWIFYQHFASFCCLKCKTTQSIHQRTVCLSIRTGMLRINWVGAEMNMLLCLSEDAWNRLMETLCWSDMKECNYLDVLTVKLVSTQKCLLYLFEWWCLSWFGWSNLWFYWPVLVSFSSQWAFLRHQEIDDLAVLLLLCLSWLFLPLTSF